MAPFRDSPARDGQPFLKWAGGKRALAPQIYKLLPYDIARRTLDALITQHRAQRKQLIGQRGTIEAAIAELRALRERAYRSTGGNRAGPRPEGSLRAAMAVIPASTPTGVRGSYGRPPASHRTWTRWPNSGASLS